MQTRRVLKEADEIDQMFLRLEQTVKRGTSVFFSFPSPGQVMAVCAIPQSLSSKCNGAKSEKTNNQGAARALD
jgi:hypothetical protein